MKDYFDFLKKFPSLFSNDNSLLEIIKDKKTILDWEEKQRVALKKEHLPEEWSEIGIVLDDPYNTLIRDLVKFPDGQHRGYIRSVTTASLKGGKGVVILPEYNGKLLLLHQYRHPTRKWHFEVPRGYGEPELGAEENARKEIDEEIGGVINEIINLGDFYNNTGYETFPVTLFFARLEMVGNPNENEGIESFVWLTVEEFETWLGTGKITDGFTIAAYTFAKIKGLI